MDEITADVVLEVIVRHSHRQPIWTSSRVLAKMGVTQWWLPERKPLLHRLDRLLRSMAEDGLLAERPRRQTSRNTRDEIAYELPDDGTQPRHPTDG